MQQEVVFRFREGIEDYKGTLQTFMSPADQVAFERRFDVGLGGLESEAKVEWILWLGWRAWHREVPGATGDFDLFLEQLEDYDFPTEPKPDPTVAPA